MKRIFSFVTGVFTGGLLIYGAMNYHILRAQDGFHVIPKVHAQLAATYADIRGFGIADWASHAEIAAALVNSNRKELLDGAIDDTLEKGIDRLLQGRSR